MQPFAHSRCHGVTTTTYDVVLKGLPDWRFAPVPLPTSTTSHPTTQPAPQPAAAMSPDPIILDGGETLKFLVPFYRQGTTPTPWDCVQQRWAILHMLLHDAFAATGGVAFQNWVYPRRTVLDRYAQYKINDGTEGHDEDDDKEDPQAPQVLPGQSEERHRWVEVHLDLNRHRTMAFFKFSHRPDEEQFLRVFAADPCWMDYFVATDGYMPSLIGDAPPQAPCSAIYRGWNQRSRLRQAAETTTNPKGRISAANNGLLYAERATARAVTSACGAAAM